MSVWVADAAAAHPLPGRCLGRHRQVLVADAQAEVYLTPGEDAEDTNVVACAYGHRPVRLGLVARRRSTKYMEERFDGVQREVLAGPLVAFEEVANPYGCGFCHWGVVVRDLRSGHLVRDEPTGTPTNPAFNENFGVGPTTALVLQRDGTVAWIAFAGAAEGGYQVHLAGPAGSRMLAAEPRIAPGSLALADGTLYWTANGVPSSAPTAP